jgi:hypothetical protein
MVQLLFAIVLLASTVSGQSPFRVSVHSIGDKIWPGSPAIFAVSLFPNGAEAVGVNEGEVTLVVRDSSGQIAQWPLTPVLRIRFPLSLKPLSLATEYWLLSEEQSAAIEKGRYEIEAKVGAVTSRKLRLTVSEIPTEETTNEAAKRLRLVASFQALSGDAGASLATLLEGVVRYPDHIPLHYELALAHIAAGAVSEAQSAVRKAIALFEERFPEAEHAPVEYLRLRDSIDWGLIEKVKP